jgi:hypothetical protein
MKYKHVTEIIDYNSVLSLSPAEIEEANRHAVECESCKAALEAARVSALLIQERARTEFKVQPSPFFHTRVMAAWREQQTVESVPAFVRLWKSASALVSTMAVATIALAAMTFVFPEPATAVPEETVSAYSAESVVFDQADEQLTYEQVLSTIYEQEDEAK